MSRPDITSASHHDSKLACNTVQREEWSEVKQVWNENKRRQLLKGEKTKPEKKNKSKGWLDWLTLTQGCVRHKRNKEFPHTTSQCVCTCVCVYMHKPHSRCDATDCNRKRGNQKMQSFSDVCHRGALPFAPFLACATNPNQKKMVYMVNMRFCVLF